MTTMAGGLGERTEDESRAGMANNNGISLNTAVATRSLDGRHAVSAYVRAESFRTEDKFPRGGSRYHDKGPAQKETEPGSQDLIRYTSLLSWSIVFCDTEISVCFKLSLYHYIPYQLLKRHLSISALNRLFASPITTLSPLLP